MQRFVQRRITLSNTVACESERIIAGEGPVCAIQTIAHAPSSSTIRSGPGSQSARMTLSNRLVLSKHDKKASISRADLFFWLGFKLRPIFFLALLSGWWSQETQWRFVRQQCTFQWIGMRLFHALHGGPKRVCRHLCRRVWRVSRKRSVHLCWCWLVQETDYICFQMPRHDTCSRVRLPTTYTLHSHS